MKTLEDILISRGQLEKIYRGKLGIYLWRGLNIDDERNNPLYPDLAPRTLPSGDIRQPDVDTEDRDGELWVKAEIGKGTSTVDKEGIFGYKKWEYFLIPGDVEIPDEIIITKDFYMTKKKCWHYSISPNEDMLVSDFLKALDKLARRAGIKLKDKKHASNR